MPKYAQIQDISETVYCVSVSYLSSEVESENLILLADEEDVRPGDIYDNGTWTRPAPGPPVEPEPSQEQRIVQLESENVALKDRIEATEGALLAIMDLM